METSPLPQERALQLPIGTRLREYEIRRVIASGTSGTVYQAWDHALRRLVAVRQYLPEHAAMRDAEGSEARVSAAATATHAAGLKAFAAEARVLAGGDHPALAKVYRFWEEDSAATLVMPYYEGPTLHSVLEVPGRLQDEAEVRGWLRPILDAVEVLHAQRHWHHHIGPDNIVLTGSGPVLLDAGCARHGAAALPGAHTAGLKHGYAAPEQYKPAGRKTAGAAADLYALAAVAYRAIAGAAPPSAAERTAADAFVPLAQRAGTRCSAGFAHTIDRLLSMSPESRPQSVAEFRQWVGGLETRASPIALEDAFDPMSEPFGTAAPEPTQPLLTQPETGPEEAAVAADAAHGPHGAAPKNASTGSEAHPEPFEPAPRSLLSPRLAVAVGLLSIAALAAFAIGLDATEPAAPTAAAPTPQARTMPTPSRTNAAPATRPGSATRATASSSAPSVTMRCEDVLYEATLRRLSADETAFLKKECR